IATGGGLGGLIPEGGIGLGAVGEQLANPLNVIPGGGARGGPRAVRGRAARGVGQTGVRGAIAGLTRGKVRWLDDAGRAAVPEAVARTADRFTGPVVPSAPGPGRPATRGA